jgi:hypothetical protein
VYGPVTQGKTRVGQLIDRRDWFCDCGRISARECNSDCKRTYQNHLDQVTRTELESEIPSHTQNDDLLVKVPSLEQILCRLIRLWSGDSIAPLNLCSALFLVPGVCPHQPECCRLLRTRRHALVTVPRKAGERTRGTGAQVGFQADQSRAVFHGIPGSSSRIRLEKAGSRSAARARSLMWLRRLSSTPTNAGRRTGVSTSVYIALWTPSEDSQRA